MGKRALAIFGSVACVLAMAPVLVASKPVKTLVIGEPFEIPAGFGCAFNVAGSPDGGQKVTEFSDGHTVIKGDAVITLTNLSSGSSYIQDSKYKAVEIYDAATNSITGIGKGRIFFSLFPGDQGPTGVVAEPGALLAIDGEFGFTLDLDTLVFTSFSLDGTFTDICAAIAG